MAQDLFEAFTVGHLTKGRGNGLKFLAMTGDVIIKPFAENHSHFLIDKDNVCTAFTGLNFFTGLPELSGGNDTKHCRLKFGAGRIETDDYDPNGTGLDPEGGVATIQFHFMDSRTNDSQTVHGMSDISPLGSGSIEIIAGWAVGGFDIVDAQFASNNPVGVVEGGVDMIAPLSLMAISGNSIKFAIGAPYEQEGGTQITIGGSTSLKFSLTVLARDGVTK